jgi:glucuronate isomerase
MTFIHDDFLLTNKYARQLYHEYAEPEPILDYHTHLPPCDIAANRRFANLYEMWMAGDHYKWRAMRANGIPEEYCTGKAPPLEKFQAWAHTVPQTLRNPLYHWAQLELKRYFDIDELLDERSAKIIWDRANAQLTDDALAVQGILRRFRVRGVCTTDDPTDDLEAQQQVNVQGHPFRVFPTFRPDGAFRLDKVEAFNSWIDRLGAVTATEIVDYQDLLNALDTRHAYFHSVGCRLSDHGFSFCPGGGGSQRDAELVFARVRNGTAAAGEEQARYASHLLYFLGQLDAQRGWTKQLHLGAIRNNRSRTYGELGPDVGCDAIGDAPFGAALISLLDRWDREGALPKMIIYNSNPADNYLVSSIVGSFQDGSRAGKLQFGAAWWFLDQVEGIRWQLNALSHVGLVSRFVGMPSDSRSFMAFPRHEYFRRVLCDVLGQEMQVGALPDDLQLVGNLVRRISYHNAHDYLELDLP